MDDRAGVMDLPRNVASDDGDHFASAESVSSVDSGEQQGGTDDVVLEGNELSDNVDLLSDRQVLDAVKKLLKGGPGNPPVHQQNVDMEDGETEPVEVKVPSSKRQYNWNSTHFYPDVHDLADRSGLSVSRRRRRHSEPRCILHFADDDVTPPDDGLRSSDSGSSLSSYDEALDKHDAVMPVSELSVQLSSATRGVFGTTGSTGHIAKVDVDLDSESSDDDDAPKTWHRSPLHVRRNRPHDTHQSRPGGNAGQPHVAKLKVQAEKRRKFLQKRCQVYGWDLDADQQQPIVVDRDADEGQQQSVVSRSHEDICSIDHSPEDSFLSQVNAEQNAPHPAPVAVNDRIHQLEAVETPAVGRAQETRPSNGMSVKSVHTSNGQLPIPDSTAVNTAVKESSSFENIYDEVSLEPDETCDNGGVMQLYEPRQANVRAVYCHTKPLTSHRPPRAGTSVRPQNYNVSDRYQKQSGHSGTSDIAETVATARPSSAPCQSPQKPSIDAKSLVEEEKLKFIEYRIEYRRQHSSGNESGSGKSDGEREMRKQLGPVTMSQTAIPPDDYEYILRKIHYNRPQIKSEEKPAMRQGSELRIEIKQPQKTTHRVTVDIAKPAVPYRVESLQHAGLQHHYPPRPDLIPSPSYPSSPSVTLGVVGDGSARTVLRTSAMYAQSAAVSHSDGDQLASGGTRNAERERFRYMEPDFMRTKPSNRQYTEAIRKLQKHPREETAQTNSSDVANHMPPDADRSVSQAEHPKSPRSKQPQPLHTSKYDHQVSAKLPRQDLVRDLMCGLEHNSELTPEATAVFREQYRLSIHEPCRSAKPDQLKSSHLSCSQVFASNVCVPAKPMQVVCQKDKSTGSSSKNDSRACNNKETVFSVTGYHRPKQQKSLSDGAVLVKNDRVYSARSNEPHSSTSKTAGEPLYWRSEADKRKPIINCPEVETALNRDSQQRYFYCSGWQVDDQNFACDSSKDEMRDSRDLDAGRRAWKSAPFHGEHSLCQDTKPSGRKKSQERLVQLMSVGNQEFRSHLGSDSGCSVSYASVSTPHGVSIQQQSAVTSSEPAQVGRPSRTSQTDDPRSPKTSDYGPTRASVDYEKHVLRSQESYRSQILAHIDSTAVSSSSSMQAAPSGTFPSRQDVCKTYHTTAVPVSELDANECGPGTRTSRIFADVNGSRTTTEQEVPGTNEVEDNCVLSVAEIKAKLFGPNEDNAKKLFQRHTGTVNASATDKSGARNGIAGISFKELETKKKSCVYDELTDLENFVERLQRSTDEAVENSSGSNNASVPDSSADDVKRLSITNVKMLESGRGKQSPSFEYAKEWLTNSRPVSLPANTDNMSDRVIKSTAGKLNVTSSVVSGVPAKQHHDHFVAHRSADILPPDRQRIADGNAGSNTSQSTPTKLLLPGVLRARPGMERGSASSSARRSLPSLTEKDAELWRNMLSRVQENENRKQDKAVSVEQLSDPRFAAEAENDSYVNSQCPGPSIPVGRNMAVNVMQSTPDVVTESPYSKPRQTLRDLKCRSESRVKGTRMPHTNADSGYVDGESDSHGSSDLSKWRTSESNGSEELELQKYSGDEAEEAKSFGRYSDEANENFSSVIALKRGSNESPETRSRYQQNRQEDKFNKNVDFLHAPSLSEKSDSFSPSTKREFELSEPLVPKLSGSISSTTGLRKSMPAKPLYVSPLAQTYGMYMGPSFAASRSTGSGSGSTAVDSVRLLASSKANSSRMSLLSRDLRHSAEEARQSSVTSPSFTPLSAGSAGFQSEQSSTYGAVFTPYMKREDSQMSRRNIGSANVAEMKHKVVEMEPNQYQANRMLERTVDQGSTRTFRHESDHFLYKREVVNEPHVKVTRQVSTMKRERTSRVETHGHPKTSPAEVSVTQLEDKSEMSDGDMTDATDTTLDVIVGANQSWTPTVDAVDFSDVEFLSLANLPVKPDTGFVQGSSSYSTLTDAHWVRSGDGNGDACVANASGEMQLYKKNKSDVKADQDGNPVQRRRSIKELVHSFEGMTSAFMRVRPRSVEFCLSSSSSEDENQGGVVPEKKRKNVALRTSSSFKEASRSDRRLNEQTCVRNK